MFIERRGDHDLTPMPNRRPSMLKLASLAIVALMLAACAGLATHLVAPRVTVESIAVGGIRGSDALVTLSLRLENPNAVELTMQSLRFALSVNDIALTSGTTVQGETIAAGGSAVIDVETHTNINAVLKLITLSTSHRAASLEYAVDGEAIVQNGVRLPFARRGDIPLPPAPPIQSR